MANGESILADFLSKMTVLDLLGVLAAIGIVITTLYYVVKHGYKWIETYRLKRNLMENKMKMCDARSGDIEKLKKDNDAIKDDIAAINGKMNTMFQMMLEMRQHNDENDRARIKDRISQLYRYHKYKKQWTTMEKESMEDLIASYEACGGTNSFVHETVQKEMYTWDIVDD